MAAVHLGKDVLHLTLEVAIKYEDECLYVLGCDACARAHIAFQECDNCEWLGFVTCVVLCLYRSRRRMQTLSIHFHLPNSRVDW